MMLRIAGTVNDSIVDGTGIRFTIFTQGCPHHCVGCHNPETHDFNGGKDIDTDELIEKIKKNPLLDGVTFSGGEPFIQAEILAALGKKIKALGLNIVTYTGYTFEELYENRDKNGWDKLLEVTDYLIDGKFKIDKKDWTAKFRGSSNQRYLDCQESIRQGKAVEIEP
ncbi:MAG: anaerobic ribonucleoside-triphosphate reductase activating protein [Ruminococcus sp.]|nr:anaerobic ribonucleoside-triphosphate reductase activating protein [Ruminococcus sp.]